MVSIVFWIQQLLFVGLQWNSLTVGNDRCHLLDNQNYGVWRETNENSIRIQFILHTALKISVLKLRENRKKC